MRLLRAATVVPVGVQRPAGGTDSMGVRHKLSARGLEVALREARAQALDKATRVKITDGDGLNLVARPTGGASWVLLYRRAGQRVPLTLGPYPAVGLAQARTLADKARSQLADGVDPQSAQKAGKTPPKGSDTVQRLVADWLACQRISEVYRGNIEAALLKDVLPAIGGRRPEDVQRDDVLAILRGIEARGSLVMLRRVRMWLGMCWEFGIDDEARPALKASPVPSGHLRSFMAPVVGHFPAVTRPDDVPALMLAIRSYGNPLVRQLLVLSAYLFARPSELRESTWAEFDLPGARWTIPAERTKLRREHWVPLAPSVLALLREHQGLVGDEGLLFPGRRYGKPLSEATASQALDAVGYKGRHSPHGFRATARTVLVEHLGAAPDVVEKQLAHEQSSKLARAYMRAEWWAERVALMQTWADWLDRAGRPS